jgi:hypothetical protein
MHVCQEDLGKAARFFAAAKRAKAFMSFDD